ncbi:hypothetical protein [Polaribacter sp.]|uniref:hypothetical protein n=1 Tax=Polaribacter sp. TaxID=1920175 RepID=UPI003F6B6E76
MRQTTLDELKMTVYQKDSTAAAVVLYEHANVYLDPKNDYNTRTDYYYRIKILDKKAFDKANISIDLYKKKKVKDIKAMTYNISDTGAMHVTPIDNDKIFEVEESKNWTAHRFTMPNIKEGSVIEYSYSIISPYLGIPDWYFQSDIPKIKSEFDAAILGNYKYNVRITGYQKLDKDKPSVNKKCVYLDGIGEGACLIYSYGMYNIPAFKEEGYMLSKDNYISHLSFDLESHTDTRGVVEDYTSTWKDADKKFKKIYLNNQTSKKSFFRKKIPEDILLTKNDLEKAKKIYDFIKNHFTWNDRYWNFEDENVKQAFDAKVGTAGEINLSLYNTLQAAEIESDLVILSTREHGIPTTLYPVIFDFNYLIVKVKIDEKDYYLDATDDFLPFGQVPFRTLNGNARIINYKKESNWVKLQPKYPSVKNVSVKLDMNEEGDFEGSLLLHRQGYEAERQRKILYNLGDDGFVEKFEQDNPDVEVVDYEVTDKDNLEKKLQEVFKVNLIMDDDLSDKIRINPFFFDRLEQNPFKLKERNYPVDFGYTRKSNFVLSLKIPEHYTITQLPKNFAISLPNKDGLFVLKVVKNNDIVSLYSRIVISKSTFPSNEYFALKEFYKQIIIAENSYIILEKNK